VGDDSMEGVVAVDVGMEDKMAGGVIFGVVAGAISGSGSWSMGISSARDSPAGASSGGQARCWHCSLPARPAKVSQPNQVVFSNLLTERRAAIARNGGLHCCEPFAVELGPSPRCLLIGRVRENTASIRR
jgi:hypothetical protein